MGIKLQLRRKHTNAVRLVPFRVVTNVCFGIITEHIVTPCTRMRGFLCLQYMVQYVLYTEHLIFKLLGCRLIKAHIMEVCLSITVQTTVDAYAFSCTMGRGVKRKGRGVDRSTLRTAEVKNWWRCNFTSPSLFRLECNGATYNFNLRL